MVLEKNRHVKRGGLKIILDAKQLKRKGRNTKYMSTYMISWEIKPERHQKQAHLHDFAGKEMENNKVFHRKGPREGNA